MPLPLLVPVFLFLAPPPSSTLFPYTTLFRSKAIQINPEFYDAITSLANLYQKQEFWRKARSEEHTSELQSPCNLVCRLLLEKKKTTINTVRTGAEKRMIATIRRDQTQLYSAR